MADNPFAKYGGRVVYSPSDSLVSSEDPFAKYGGRVVSGPTSADSNPFAKYGGRVVSTPVSMPSPVNEQQDTPGQQSPDYWDESKDVFSNMLTSFTNRVSDVWHDSSSSFLGKVWDTANVPIVSTDQFERFAHFLGQDGEIPGWERGMFNLASGFTSPLQLGLTAGTFGTSALESGGAALLSKAGKSAEEIAAITKGLPSYMKGLSIGRYGEELAAPMAKEGLNYDLVKEGYDILNKAGLGADSLIQNHVVRRTASSMLRGAMGNTEKGIVSAEKWARLGQIGVDLGFTLPMAYGLTVTMPRLSDALKEGDYDKAGELAVESLGSGVFATLGLLNTWHEAGSLRTDIAAKTKLGVKPSEEYNQAIRYAGIFDRDSAISEQSKMDYIRDFRKQNPDVSADDLFLALNYMEAGLDPKLLEKRFNYLVQAMGKPELMIKAAEEIKSTGFSEQLNGQSHADLAMDALRNSGMKDVKVFMHADDNTAISDPSLRVRHNGETLVQFSIPGVVGKEGIPTDVTRPAKDVDTPAKIRRVVNEKRKEFGLSPLPATKLHETHSDVSDGLVSAVLAAHTPGREPLDAVRFADNALKQYKETGKLPTPEVDKDTPKTFSARNTVENLQKVLDHVGGDADKVVEWLVAEHPISELRDVLGHGRIDGKADTMLPGAMVLGKSTGQKFLDIHNGDGQAYAEAAEQHFAPKTEPTQPKLGSPEAELQTGKQRKKFHPLRSQEVGQSQLVPTSEVLKYMEQTPLSEKDAATVDALAERYKKNEGLEKKIAPIRASFDESTGELNTIGFSDRLNVLAAAKAGVEQVPVVTDLFDPNGRIIPRNPIAVDAVKADLSMSEARLKELAESLSLKDKSEEYKQQLIRAFDPRLLNDNLKQIAKEQHDYFTETLEMAQAAGALGHGVEFYAPHFWKDLDKDNPLVRRLVHEAQSGSFAVNTTMARHRLFQAAFEGVMLGKELEHTDLVSLAAHNRAEFQKVIAARNFVERMRAAGAVGSDGRPFIAPEGVARVISGANGENPAIMLDPRRIPDIRISNKEIDRLRANGQLDRFIKDGTIVVHNEQLTLGNLGERMEKLDLEFKRLYADQTPEPGSKMAESIRRMNEQYGMMEAVRNAETPEAQAAALRAFNEKYRPTYLWETSDFRNIDVPAMKNWRWMLTDPKGQTVLAHTNMRVHPELYEYLNRRLGGEETWKNPVAKGVLKVTTEAKGMLLSIDTFHFFQEAIRGLMSGIAPTLYKPDIRSNPLLRMGIEEGLTVFTETRDMQQLQSVLEGHGHSKIMRKIPGLGKMIDGFQSFLFQKYIPGLKARAFESMFDRYRAKYPELSVREVARMTAADVNNRFGGQNYARMGRSLNTMNLTRIFALAPDWLESELKFYGSVIGGNKIARQDTALAVLGLWGVARVLNYMATGDGHYEAPFALAVKDEDGRDKLYSIRTLPTDFLHLVNDPMGFIKGRTSPLVRTANQMYNGTDEWGRKLPEHDVAFNLLTSAAKNVAPIPVQTAIKKMSGEQSTGMTTSDSVIKMAGAAVMPYRTEASKLASEKASMMSSNGPVDEAHLRTHQAMIRLEDQMRSGRVPITELNTLVESGQLSPQDAREVQRRVEQTKNMSPDTARLFALASRLPMKDFFEVWDAATPSEREVLSKMLIQKKNSYIRKASKEMTVEARKTDPTLNKIKELFPNQLYF